MPPSELDVGEAEVQVRGSAAGEPADGASWGPKGQRCRIGGLREARAGPEIHCSRYQPCSHQVALAPRAACRPLRRPCRGWLALRWWLTSPPAHRCVRHSTQAADASAVPETVRGGMAQFVQTLTTPETELEQQVGRGWAGSALQRQGRPVRSAGLPHAPANASFLPALRGAPTLPHDSHA